MLMNDKEEYEKWLQEVQSGGGGFSSVPRTPAVVPEPVPDPTEDLSPVVSSAIKAKYGLPAGFASEDLRLAQARADETRTAADIGKAAGDLGFAIAGVAPQKDDIYESIKKSADRPVENIINQRKTVVEDEKLARQQELDDPNSLKSQVARNVAAEQLKRVGGDPSLIEGLSAADLARGGFAGSSLNAITSADWHKTGHETKQSEGEKNRLFKEEEEKRKREFQAQENEKNRGIKKDISKEVSGRIANRFSHSDEQIDKRFANQVHKDVVNKIKTDKVLGQRLNQYQNLDNALTAIIKPENITPQQVHEFQQAVRSNMGIKGTSGVGEREATYINSLGLNAANWMQFVTGNPASLAKDSKLMEHLKDLARTEQNSIRQQKDQRIKTLTAGYDSIYEKNPQYRKDLDAAISAVGGQFETANPPTEISTGFSDEKKRRLEELRAKKAAGTLGR